MWKLLLLCLVLEVIYAATFPDSAGQEMLSTIKPRLSKADVAKESWSNLSMTLRHGHLVYVYGNYTTHEGDTRWSIRQERTASDLENDLQKRALMIGDDRK